jgi:hypothetical protein
LTLLGEIEIFESSAAALPYLYDALAEGPLAPELAFVVHESLAWCLRGTDGLLATQPHVRAAGDLAASLGSPGLVARALSLQAEIHLGLGRSDAFELAGRARDVGARRHGSWRGGLRTCICGTWAHGARKRTVDVPALVPRLDPGDAGALER